MQADHGDEQDVAAIAAEIKHYLAMNPGAADSVEGIWRWWLPPSFAHARRATVEQALARLVADGAMHERLLPDSSRLYEAAVRPRRH